MFRPPREALGIPGQRPRFAHKRGGDWRKPRLAQERRDRLPRLAFEPGGERAFIQVGFEIDDERRLALGRDGVPQASRQGVDGASLKAGLGDDRLPAHVSIRVVQRDVFQRRPGETFANEP